MRRIGIGSLLTASRLSLAAEREHRELEHCFYAEPTDEFYARLKALVVPTTRTGGGGYEDDLSTVVRSEDSFEWYKCADVKDQSQFQVRDDGITMRLRRTTYLCGRVVYHLCVKSKENGDTIEAESRFNGVDAFSAYNLLMRNSKYGMWKTRVTLVTPMNNFKYEVDVPLLTGEHCRDLNAKWGTVIKVDLEHGGAISLDTAIKEFPIPVKRIISDKDEIHELYKTTFRRKLK